MTNARGEAALVKKALDHIRDLPTGHAVKVHGSAYGSAGEPDITACIDGRAIHLEAKRLGEKPTPVQYASLRRWEKTGALVGWFNSMDVLYDLLLKVWDRDWVNPQLCAHRYAADGGTCARCGARV